MTDERDDLDVRSIVEEASPELGPEARGRTVEAMAAVRPARAVWRRRLAGALVAAAALVVGIGLLPFGPRDGREAWARAARMASQADSLHVVGTVRMDGGEYQFEKWVCADGFRRYEVTDGDEVVALELHDETAEVWFVAQDEEKSGWLERNAVGIGGASPASRGDALMDLVQLVPFMKNCGDLELTVHQATAANGSPVEIVEGSGTSENELHDCRYGVVYRGTPLKFRAEVDAETGLLRSLGCWKAAGEVWHRDVDTPRRWLPGAGILSTIWRSTSEQWEPIYATEIVEWNVEVPEGAREFTWPEGTRVQYQPWLETRAAQELARAEVGEGTVILHALDVNERGDIFVTVSRPGRGVVGTPWCAKVENPDFAAVDDSGRAYRQSGHYCGGMCGFDREYVVTDLDGGYGPTSRSLTITMWPFSDEWHTGESVVFEDVPLPEPQKGVQLYKETAEYIQY